MTPQQFIAAYEQALASQRWENIEPLMHTEVCVTFSTGSVHKGIEAVKQTYEKNFAAIKNEQFAITNVHVVSSNEHLAVYLFHFQWQGIIDGQPASGAGKGTATIVVEQGQWKLLAEHLGR